MKNNITRRDLLKFAGGSALGILFTPLPWKLLDDSAIWTQNWLLTPKLSHGPITTKYSVCTLCSAGCSVAARCVDSIPYSLSGVAGHPVDHGKLCSRGLSGHHLAHHPLRMTIPHKFSGKEPGSRLIPVSIETSVKEISDAVQRAEGSVVILDKNPRRISSRQYQTFTSNFKKGIYATVPSGEDSTLKILREMSANKKISYGYDFKNTKMIVSFGSPILDGFGIPGEMTALSGERKQNGIKIVQIESTQSRTALQSDQWFALRPGTEGVFALTIAHILFAEHLLPRTPLLSIDDRKAIERRSERFSPEATLSITGIDTAAVRTFARQLASTSPAIVMSGSDPGGGPLPTETEKAIALLNILIGSVGKSGGIVAKQDSEAHHEINWHDIPDHSISVLIIDSAENGYALPWNLIEKKLIPQSNIVVSLSPFLGETTAHADYLLPITTYYESVQDVPSPAVSGKETFAIAQPLMSKPDGTIDEREFISLLSGAIGIQPETTSYEDQLKEKTLKIFESKNGSVFSFSQKSSVPVSTFGSSGELYAALNEGAVWIQEPEHRSELGRFTPTIDPRSGISFTMGTAELHSLLFMPFGWRGATSSTSVSPIMSKLFQESELRNQGNSVLLNPQTLQDAGLSDRENAIVETSRGSVTVTVRSSNTIPPNVIAASIAPLNNNSPSSEYLNHSTLLSLCDVQSDGTWRLTNATIRKQLV